MNKTVLLAKLLGVPPPKRVRAVPPRRLTMFVGIHKKKYGPSDWARDLARLNEHGSV